MRDVAVTSERKIDVQHIDSDKELNEPIVPTNHLTGMRQLPVAKLPGTDGMVLCRTKAGLLLSQQVISLLLHWCSIRNNAH